MKYIYFLGIIIALLSHIPLIAQRGYSIFVADKSQTVRGRVIDRYSKEPLVGVLVSVENAYPYISTYSNDNGTFILTGVPIGRQTISGDFRGYNKLFQRDVVITSGKENYIELEMTTTSDEIGNRPVNDFLPVSARSFSVDEVQRYPAAVTDIGRLFTSFNGIALILEQQNDVTINGNPSSMALWRLEGLDIINPNHGSRPNGAGGALTIFSNSLLSNSDIVTNAWSADYGNAASGIFDINFRKGNTTKREHTFRAGVLGLDFATEGPIKNEQSSYVVNYRYSTMGLLNKAGIYIVRPNVSTEFQDLSFKLHFADKSSRTIFTVFGAGGTQHERWRTPEDTLKWTTDLEYLKVRADETQGILGATLTRVLSSKSYLKFVLGTSALFADWDYDKPTSSRADAFYRLETRRFHTMKTGFLTTFGHKFNNKTRLKAGLNIYHHYAYDFYADARAQAYTVFTNHTTSTLFSQAYVQTGHTINKHWSMNIGVHGAYYALNQRSSVEPRLALMYRPNRKINVTAAYGLHSMVLPTGTLWITPNYTTTSRDAYPNLNLPFIKTHHGVLSYRQALTQQLYYQIEGFYQHLYNVPVEALDTSSMSYLLVRDYYGTSAFSSAGLGKNYGVGLTVEKIMDKGYHVLLSASWQRSYYRDFSGNWYQTNGDRRYITTLTMNKEFTLKNESIIQTGIRFYAQDGRPYTPADTAASIANNRLILQQTQRNTARFEPYIRTDFRIAFRKNAEKLTYIVSLDIQNIFNRRPTNFYVYDQVKHSPTFVKGAGLLPIFNFQIDF